MEHATFTVQVPLPEGWSTMSTAEQLAWVDATTADLNRTGTTVSAGFGS